MINEVRREAQKAVEQQTLEKIVKQEKEGTTITVYGAEDPDHAIDTMYEAANNPASIAYLLSHSIIAHGGNVSEETIDAFKKYMVKAISTISQKGENRLDTCEQTHGVMLSARDLYLNWALLPPGQRPDLRDIKVDNTLSGYVNRLT